MSPRMPVVEKYRAVGIHDFQDREQVETVVKPAIDLVYQMTGAAELYAFATDRREPPEARLLAKAKVEAIHELRASEHGNRGDIDLDMLRAGTCMLNSLTWSSAEYYGGGPEGRPPYTSDEAWNARRPEHLQRRMREAQEAARPARQPEAA